MSKGTLIKLVLVGDIILIAVLWMLQDQMGMSTPMLAGLSVLIVVASVANAAMLQRVPMKNKTPENAENGDNE